MVSRIIKLDSSEPFKWPLFPHRFRSRIFGFGRNVAKNISSFPTRGLYHALNMRVKIQWSKETNLSLSGTYLGSYRAVYWFACNLVLVLVLVLIKDSVPIKRILTQKASVYPGFILMSVVIV